MSRDKSGIRKTFHMGWGPQGRAGLNPLQLQAVRKPPASPSFSTLTCKMGQIM